MLFNDAAHCLKWNRRPCSTVEVSQPQGLQILRVSGRQ